MTEIGVLGGIGVLMVVVYGLAGLAFVALALRYTI